MLVSAIYSMIDVVGMDVSGDGLFNIFMLLVLDNFPRDGCMIR